MQIRLRAIGAALALTALVACSDDSSDVASTGSTTAPPQSAPSTTSVPTTAPPTSAAPRTTAATSGGSLTGGTPEGDAAEAFATVFDSSTPLEAKAPHLVEADALAETITAYAGAGQRMGGIKLTPTAVQVDGDAAAVTYDVYFGTTKQYEGMSGSIERSGDTWVVSRDEFCGFMQSARTPCPA